MCSGAIFLNNAWGMELPAAVGSVCLSDYFIRMCFNSSKLWFSVLGILLLYVVIPNLDV